MKIAAIQMRSVLDFEENLEKIRRFLKEAKENGATAAFLPEVFYSLGDGTKASPHLVDGNDDHYENIKNLARNAGLYILGGSAASLKNGKVVNRSFNFAPDGTDLGEYDKMNLFAVDLSKHPSNTVIDEARIYARGNSPKVIEFEGFKLGLSICFDLRFPELFRSYSFAGAEILSISSAFTVPTGKAHWHTLVRARAIENQCYVVAAAQWGVHNEKISTYGHSLIVDPWGEILADAGEGEKVIYAEVDREKLESVRGRLNVRRDPKI